MRPSPPLWFVAALLVMSMTPVRASAQVIEGNWELFRAGDLGGRTVSWMAVSNQQGTGFSIRGVDQGWGGFGQIEDGQGRYDWLATDGTSGVTTLSVDCDGNLLGNVKGAAGLNWYFVARRSEGPIPEESRPKDCRGPSGGR